MTVNFTQGHDKVSGNVQQAAQQLL